MAENTTPATPVDNFSVLVERTKKVLKKHPSMSVGDFVNGYLFALLSEIRTETNETRESLDDLWDYVGEIPEEPVLDQIEQVILALASYLDTVLVRSGWLGAGGPTEAFPTDMKEQFVTLGKKLAEVQQRIAEARSLAEGIDEGDAEEDDEDEEEEATDEATEAAAPDPAVTTEATATKPAEA